MSKLAMATRLTLGFCLVLLVVPAGAAAGGTVRYVAPGGSCGGVTPCYATIQAAVDAATGGDEIRVAAGTYRGQQTVNRPGWNNTYSFTQVVFIEETLALRGGFAPGHWEAPDPVSNPTIIDAEQQGRGVTLFGDWSQTVTFEGFTITGGDYTGLGNPPGVGILNCRRTGSDCGGGLYAFGVTLRLRDCTINDNIASRTADSSDGGGLYVWDLQPGSRIENVVLSDNHADSPYSEGGGMMIVGGAGATIVGCTVARNSAAAGGGGISIDDPDRAAVVIEDTVFLDNSTPGGVNQDEDGGALSARLGRDGLALRMDRVRMEGNQARAWGAAIHLYKVGPSPTQATLNNLLLVDNRTTSAQPTAAVIAVERGYNFDLSLAHVTAANNAAPAFLRADGPYAGRDLTITLTNTLVVSATHVFSLRETAGDVLLRHDHTLAHQVTNLHTTEAGAPQFEATHAVTGNPKVDSSGHLLAGSAAIDAGTDAGLRWDVDGQPRPSGSGFDVGADEYVVLRTYMPMMLRRR
jgi:hypothetical protein